MSEHEHNITFDTLKLVQRLEAAGIPRAIAVAQAEAIRTTFAEAQLVTRSRLDSGLVGLENRLLLKLGGILSIAVAVFGAIVAVVGR